MKIQLISLFVVDFIAFCQSIDLNARYELVDHFLTATSLDTVVLYTSCYPLHDRIKYMKKLNDKLITACHRNGRDFEENFNLDDLFTPSMYSPLLGVIFDWTCYKEMASFQFSDNWLWSASYRWLMIMEINSTRNIKTFLKSKRISLTVNSEVLLAYPNETNNVVNKWHIFDVYRTAFEPRGRLMVDTVNKIYRKWGNRSWKFDKRSNLENLTINAVMIGNPYGQLTQNNSINIAPSQEKLVEYLKTSDVDRLNLVQKFCYAVMYPLTRNLLNLTMNIKTTDSWGFKVNDSWDGIVGMVISGEADFSITINAIRPERLDVVDYSAISTFKHQPCFIFRHPRSPTSSVNVFLRPFNTSVWISIIIVMILSVLVYWIIIHYGSNQTFKLKILSDIVLLKIGTLCQQGTVMEYRKFSNRLMVLLMFVFSLVVYQFYSSSIVSGLLRPTVMSIDTVKKLDESGLDVGVEDFNILIRLIEEYGKINPYMKRIIDKKIKPKSQYLLGSDGVKEIKKGHYAFFTNPSYTYWLINDVFTEKEKCDLSELPLSRPEVTAFLIRKNSPYKELMNYANNILLEVGLVERELRKWFANKPKCVESRITEEWLVSVEIDDVRSLLIFLFIGFVVAYTVLVIEIIVHRFFTKKKKHQKHSVFIN